MKKLILMVEDDVDIINLSKGYLEKEGFSVSVAMSVKFGIEKIKVEKPDIILLDLMLGDGDGSEVIKWLKRNEDYSNVPVIILTAKSSEVDKVLLLELGADDYITKPFSIRELVARIRTVLRRYDNKTAQKQNKFEIDGLKINFDSFEVIVDNEVINLTRKEFKILELLVKNKGIVLSKEKILSSIWDDHSNIQDDSRTVDVHISKIKKKLKKYADKITVVRGVGYKFQV
ncbi:MAG: response regulator transcription factor [Spirochaetia bacterium]|nr:response regulator transcription factor [Spirochaetota bacterium]MCX8096238.1 response regulator transcription factor [Spirochaetota bacterium]MDW8112669.1 response regulator transcription factor [Spirochaetia bacterium]